MSNFKDAVVNKIIEISENKGHSKLREISDTLGLKRTIKSSEAVDMLHRCICESDCVERLDWELYKLGFIVCVCGCDNWFQTRDVYYNDENFYVFGECGHYLYKPHATDENYEFMAEYCSKCAILFN